jgi:hypothetical protein
MEQAVIVSAVRTPIGKFMGGLAPLSAPELGAKVVAEAVRRAEIEPNQVDEAIMGNVVQAGLGQNPARQAALRGGLDPRVAAMTINKVCGSGLKAVALASQAVGRLRKLSHGRYRRAGGRKVRCHAARTGPIRAGQPSQSGARDQVVFFWRANCASGDSAKERRAGDY